MYSEPQKKFYKLNKNIYINKFPLFLFKNCIHCQFVIEINFFSLKFANTVKFIQAHSLNGGIVVR